MTSLAPWQPSPFANPLTVPPGQRDWAPPAAGAVTGDQFQIDGAPVFSFSIITLSLNKYFSKAASDDSVQALLAEVMDNIKRTLSTSDQNRINIESADKKAVLAEQKKAMDDAAAKQADAEAKNNQTSVWDKIKAAFETFAALLSVAVGAFLIATGAGAPVGIALILAGSVGLISAIDSNVQAATGHGIAGNIALDLGQSKQQAATADSGFDGAFAVVGLIAGIAGFCVGFMGTELTEVAELASTIANSVNAGVAIDTGAGDVAASIDTYQATTDQADAKDDRAKSDQLTAVMTELDAFISMVIKNMSDTYKIFDNIMASSIDAAKDVTRTLTQAQFVG